MSMKGMVLIEIMAVVFFTLMLIAVIYITPILFSEAARSLALASAEAVAKDIAGLLTMSNAATDRITIHYDCPTDKYLYNIRIEDGIVTVEMLDEEKKTLETKSSVTLVSITNEFEFTETLKIKNIRENHHKEINIEVT